MHANRGYAAVLTVLMVLSFFSEAVFARGYYYRAPPPRYRPPPPMRVMPKPVAPRQLAPRQMPPKSPKSTPGLKTPSQANNPAAGRQLTGAPPRGPKSPKNFVTPTNPPGKPNIPAGHIAVPSRDGTGTVYRAPGTTGNANTVRVMPPSKDYPTGRSVTYNKYGQPINPATGKPGRGKEDTHVPLPPDGK